MTCKIYKVEDLERPFYIQDFQEADHLIIALSGYGQNFEWFGSIKKYAKKYNFSKFWVRDTSRAYWHGKLPGIGDGFKPLTSFIKEKIIESKAKQVMMIGLSMGGYGALLFGCLCNVNLVICFSGQTYLPEHRRTKYNLYEKWKDIDIDENYLNLKTVFEKYNISNRTIYKLIYGETNKADKKYAKYLENQRGVELYPVNTNTHNSYPLAKKSGYIDKFITDFLENKYEL